MGRPKSCLRIQGAATRDVEPAQRRLKEAFIRLHSSSVTSLPATCEVGDFVFNLVIPSGTRSMKKSPSKSTPQTRTTGRGHSGDEETSAQKPHTDAPQLNESTTTLSLAFATLTENTRGWVSSPVLPRRTSHACALRGPQRPRRPRHCLQRPFTLWLLLLFWFVSSGTTQRCG